MICLQDVKAFLSCGLLLLLHSCHGSEIIGGHEVEPHSLPYMALLVANGPKCGGVLIGPEWVLTAAHCVGIKKVLLGVHSIRKEETDSRQMRSVKKPVPHPCFEAEDKVNDLMLLKLDKKVKLTKAVKWLKLDKTIKDPAAGTRCVVAGWGKTNNIAKNMSDVLKSVNVTVVERTKCNSPDFYNLNPVITSGMICAGGDAENRGDTCQGDSGGPLLCSNALVGITSFGRKCGIIKKPGVYTFLSAKQLAWIKTTMKQSEMD